MSKTDFVLITGASGGIGLELAKVFAEHEHSLVLVARSEEKLNAIADDLKKKHKIDVRVYAADLNDRERAHDLYRWAKGNGIKVNCLVNNAGVGTFGKFAKTEWKKNSDMLDLNMYTLTYLTHLFLPDLIANGAGKILNVASTAAFQPGPLMAVYYATKAYVLSFSEALAEELLGTGVTVTALCPGPTESNFFANANLQNSKLFSRMSVATSEDVAKYGYKSLMAGKVIAVHGMMGKMSAQSVRFFPRVLVRKMARKIQEAVKTQH